MTVHAKPEADRSVHSASVDCPCRPKRMVDVLTGETVYRHRDRHRDEDGRYLDPQHPERKPQ